MTTYVCEHRNPDTDAIVAAISYAALYNMLGENDYIPVRLGIVNDETAFLLKRFGFEAPPMISSVRTQVRDVEYDKPPRLAAGVPVSYAWNLLLEHVKMLKRGESIEMPTYSYLTCSRQKETVPMGPHDVVLIEGIMALSDARLRKMMDIKVFVDADGDDRLIRVISRDCIERGRTAQAVIDRYQRVLKPMHQLHIEPTKKFANIIIPEGGNNEVAINLITDYIKGRLTTNKKK